jgi:hypothetical protein
MAPRSLPDSSSGSPEPLVATRSTLDRRWHALTEGIGTQLGLSRDHLLVNPEYVNERVWAGFVGAACETVERQRGRATPVAPLAVVEGDLKAWLGFQEVWDADTSSRRFAFRHLSLTVHFGYDGDPIKPQVFRSEWSGIRNWTGAGPDFQAPGAAHPHWQFDLLETLRDLGDTDDENPLRGIEEEELVEEFKPAPLQMDVIAAIKNSTLERLHFASAAHWWRPLDGVPAHMNAPADVTGLLRWTIQCIAYTKQELARCVLR